MKKSIAIALIVAMSFTAKAKADYSPSGSDLLGEGAICYLATQVTNALQPPETSNLKRLCVNLGVGIGVATFREFLESKDGNEGTASWARWGTGVLGSGIRCAMSWKF
jgi:hypothetical protein